MMTRHMLITAALLLAASASAGAQPEVASQLEAVQKQLKAGETKAAMTALKDVVAAAPKSFEARLLLGRVLDLEGQHAEARVQLEEAVQLAPDDERTTALTALGVSYAFESKADEAARYYQRAFDARMTADDRGGAAGFANALARIYLESGNLQKAEEWYRTGYETARQIPDLPAAQANLWEMRWHHALARIAARKGDKPGTEQHVAAVKAAFDKGLPENQQSTLPYLLGYVAFYAKDYRTAIVELQKGDQNDPFVLGLIAQAHEQLGERERAAEYYRKVMTVPVHNINVAFARQPARKFLR